MLMKDNGKKKIAMLILRKKKGGDSFDNMKSHNEEMSEKPMNDMGDEMDSSIGLMAAAEEILSAVEQKDPKMLKSALRSFMEMCDQEMPEEEEE